MTLKIRRAFPNDGAPGSASAEVVAHKERSSRLHGESPIAEIETKEPELPELVGEILANVSDDAVRADDHFLSLLGILALVGLVRGSVVRPRLSRFRRRFA